MSRSPIDSPKRKLILDKFISERDREIFDQNQIAIEDAINTVKNLEKEHLVEEAHLAVLEARTFFPLYASKNFDKLLNAPKGQRCTPDDIYLFNLISEERLDFFEQLEAWTGEFHKLRKKRNFDLEAMETQCIFGIPIVTKDGSIKKIMSSRTFQVGDPKVLPGHIITSIYDVTYLHAGENIIAHFAVTNPGQPKLSKVFTTERPDKLKKALISDREIEVLQLVSIGKSSKEIAAKLSLSVNTIERHRKNILIKMETRSLTGATHVAKMMKVID